MSFRAYGGGGSSLSIVRYPGDHTSLKKRLQIEFDVQILDSGRNILKPEAENTFLYWCPL